MKQLLVLLMALQLLIAALGRADRDSLTAGSVPAESAPVVEAVPAPAETSSLAEVLERIGTEYDPALAGSVGALRWAGKLLDGYAADGRDPLAAEKAAADYLAAHPDAAALESRLLRLRLAALQLASGEDLGLVREPGRRLNTDWTAPDVEELFAALCRGAGIPTPE